MSVKEINNSPKGSSTSVRTIRSLCEEDIDTHVEVVGRIERIRFLGGLLFWDVGDASGQIQTVTEPRTAESQISGVRSGSIIKLVGVVRLREKRKLSSSCIAKKLEIRSCAIEVLWSAPRNNLPYSEVRQMAEEELCSRLIEAGFTEYTITFAPPIETVTKGDLPEPLKVKFIALASQGYKAWFVRCQNSVVIGYLTCLSFNWNELLEGLASHLSRSETIQASSEAADLPPLECIKGNVDLSRYTIATKQPGAGAFNACASDVIPSIGWLRFTRRNNMLQRSLAVTNVSANSFPECTPQESDLRGRIVELSARCEFLESVSTGQSLRNLDVLSGIEDALERYGMDISQAETALDLLPDARRSLSRRPATDRFRLIWSILGNDNAASALASPDTLWQLRRLTELRLITQYAQLTYLSRESIAFLTNQPLEDTTIAILRKWLSEQPTRFSTLIETVEASGGSLSRDAAIADEALSAGLVTPCLYAGTIRITASKLSNCLYFFRRAVASQLLANSFSGASFPNILKCMPDVFPNYLDAYWEIAYSLFAPVTLTYGSMIRMLTRVGDLSEHFASNGVRFSGEHWESESRAFSFGRLLLFPSKNPLSVLAKASAGLCTTRDIALFEREDHLQLTIYDPERAIVVGSAQLYVIKAENSRAILVRGVNPSSQYRGDAKEFADAVLETAKELAGGSNIPISILCEGLGLWSADSADPAIRGYLDKVREKLPAICFDSPVMLFQFRGINIMTQRGTVLSR